LANISTTTTTPSFQPTQRAKIVKSIHLRKEGLQIKEPFYRRRAIKRTPKSTFKALLIVASLQEKVDRMSFLQQVPESLKPQECERGSGLNPPIPYIPEKYEDVDPDRKVPTIKYELENGVETRTNVWDGVGSKEQFLCHTVAIWEALQGIGLLKKHKEAEEKVLEKKEELRQARESRDLTKQQVEVCETEAEKEPLREELATLETEIKACKAAIAGAKSNQTATMASIFSTATNFLCGDGKTPWD
jgi:hypothetical protein